MPTVPNRSSDLAPGSERARKSRGTDQITKAKAGAVSIPDADPEWARAARMMWDSMLESGGSAFFESSDYATLYLICDQIDYLYRQNKDGSTKNRSPEMFKAILAGLGNLLATEGDRRKLRIELERPDDEDAEFEAAILQIFEGGKATP